jgi:DNA-binding CsgD family transcriptional regulator/tetratricopeptide (TPR) repeat protein
MIALRHGDLAQAQSLLEEALSVSQNNGLSVMRYYGLHMLGLVALERGDHKRARALGAETLALAKRIGHARGSANALYLSARAAIISGDRPTGHDLLEKSLALYRQYVDWDGMQWCLRGLGHLEIDHGDVAAASRLFRESLALSDAAGDTLEVARSLEGLAGVALDARPDRVVRLAGAAAALREALAAAPYPRERERVDRWLGAARCSLGQEAYAAVWAEASATPVEQSVALALGDDEPARVLQTAQPADPQSAREREVIRLLARGCSNRQIAEQLVIAPRTADTHVGKILTKLSLHSRAELAAWAVEHGLMSTAKAD